MPSYWDMIAAGVDPTQLPPQSPLQITVTKRKDGTPEPGPYFAQDPAQTVGEFGAPAGQFVGNALGGAARNVAGYVNNAANSFYEQFPNQAPVFPTSQSTDYDPRRAAAGGAAEQAMNLLGVGGPAAMVRPGLSAGTFGGRLAQTADKGALATAEQMHAAGAPHADILAKTGWSLGADNQWRFEINDRGAKFGRPSTAVHPDLPFQPPLPPIPKPTVNTQVPGQHVLGDIFQHPQLYKAYPELKDTPISFENMRKGSYGYVEPSTGKIGVSTSMNPKDARTTLIHELQHAVQQREGFAGGGNYADFLPAGSYVSDAAMKQAFKRYQLLAGEVEARNATRRLPLTEEQRRQSLPASTEDRPRAQQEVRINEATGIPMMKSEGAPYFPGEPRGLDFWQHKQDPAAYSNVYITPGDKRVSTRFPTAVGRTEDPLKQHLSVGLPEMLAPGNEAQLAHNMNLVSQYPGLAHLKGMSPEEQAKAYIEHARGNLNFVYQNAPRVMQQRSPLWYEGANRFTDALAGRYGVPRPAASGGTAVLSPQKDWFQNASLSERVGDLVTGAPKSWNSDMLAYARNSDALNKGDNWDIVKRIQGKRLDQLDDPLERAMWVRLYDEVRNPRHYREITPEGKLGGFVLNADGTPAKVAWGSGGEVAKAIQMFESGGDMSTISRLLGNKHKVRSFYNNIEVPNDPRFADVTADTHQVAAGLLRPLSGNTPEVAHNFGSSLDTKYQPKNYQGAKNSSVTGMQGMYPLNVEATRQVARDIGLVPRAAQSGTWEPVRELFTDVFKSNKTNIDAIDDIWRRYDRREITLDAARKEILQRAGGIGEPSWARSGAPVYDPAKASTYR